MIAVSSFKPLSESSEVSENQIEANRSWQNVFSSIVYFNDYEPMLASGKTVFVSSDEFPTIKSMAEYCGEIEGWSCIINSDIIVTDGLIAAENALNRKSATCASSRRYNFDPKIGIQSGNVDDYGLDVFIARPGVWMEAARLIPQQFRIGHCLWDTWITGFFYKTGSYYDLTPFKCIHHPNHAYRKTVFTIPAALKRNEFVRCANFPMLSLCDHGRQ